MIKFRFTRSIVSVCLLTAILCSSLLARKPITPNQDDDQQLRVILMTLSRNMATFERSLPDFVCQEELDQEVVSVDGKTEVKNVIKSSLTGRQHKQQTRVGSEYDFEERREVNSINGKKPSPAVTRQYSAGVPPPYLSGAFSSILLSHFSVSSLSDFEWTLASSPEKIGGRNCFVLKFAPNEDRHRQEYRYDDKRYESRRTGRAYVDSQEMQVVRIEFDETVLPDDLAQWHSSVDYAPMQLDDQKYWLPVTATTNLREKKTGRRLQAVHHYTDYKRYTGSITLDDKQP